MKKNHHRLPSPYTPTLGIHFLCLLAFIVNGFSIISLKKPITLSVARFQPSNTPYNIKTYFYVSHLKKKRPSLESISSDTSFFIPILWKAWNCLCKLCTFHFLSFSQTTMVGCFSSWLSWSHGIFVPKSLDDVQSPAVALGILDHFFLINHTCLYSWTPIFLFFLCYHWFFFLFLLCW